MGRNIGMDLRRPWLVLWTILFSLGGPVSLGRADAPLDKTVFTNHAADRIRAEMPDHRVAVTAPLTLEIAPPQGEARTGYLDRVYDFCRRRPAECDSVLDNYAEKLRTTSAEVDGPLDRGMLRVVVRTKAYMQDMQVHLGEHAGEMAIEPLTDDLVAAVYIDLPSALRSALEADFEILGLDRTGALAQAKANQRAGAADFAASIDHALPEDEIGLIDEDVYTSSWMALPEAWAETAAAFDNRLIVAVPGATVLLYARDGGPQSVMALRDAANDMANRNERPITTSVYRWTPQGWQRL
jgi:hypothetical protein